MASAGKDTCGCICLTGPTASGKTALALELAEEFGAEIVSMDSAIVYRHMDIGTDKPDAATRARVPHHLIDIRDPEDTYSAGAFADDAASVIAGIRSRGRLAFVVGGTLLYLRALRDGLANLPARDAAVRASIDAEAEARGWGALHAELGRVDPAAAGRIEPTDRQRIQRALEVYRVTGRPISVHQRRGRRAGPLPGLRAIALIPNARDALHAAIEERFDRMVAHGFVEEVRRLRARPGLTAASPSMRAVGYRQLWAHLDGATDWPAARERAIAATRQLGKRQLTWLRSDAGIEPLDSLDARRVDRVRRFIEAVAR